MVGDGDRLLNELLTDKPLLHDLGETLGLILYLFGTRLDWAFMVDFVDIDDLIEFTLTDDTLLLIDYLDLGDLLRLFLDISFDSSTCELCLKLLLIGLDWEFKIGLEF